MPIVANCPNLIVIFEMTMLGAILATVLTLFVTAKLPRPLPVLYDPGRIFPEADCTTIHSPRPRSATH